MFPERRLVMKLIQANLTKLRAIPLPAGKSELRVFDPDLQGFGLRIRKGAHGTLRSWIIQYRVRGKHQQTTATLGSIDKLSVAAARDRAKRDLAQAQLGLDPQSEKNENRIRSKETFATAAEHYLKHKSTRLKPRTFVQVETHLENHWKEFRNRPIHEISRRDIALQLVAIADERGPYAANRARATLSNFYTWAMKEGLVEANPVIGTNRQADEKARDRVLSDAELVTIWKACNGDDYGNIVRLLILTGQRRDEVGAIAQSEIHLADRQWNIPRERTKNGRAHSVALSDPAIAILTMAIERDGRQDRDAIFGEGSSGGGFSGWSKCKERLDKRIGEACKKPLPDWRLHDLRRTVATRMADLGVLPHVIEAILNHVSGHKAGVAGVYNRALYANETRQALDLWAAHVEALLDGKLASNVTRLKA
jgi:integrase